MAQSTEVRPEEPRDTKQSSERSWKGLYRAGGILAMLWGVCGFFTMLGGATLYKAGYPSDPEAYLQLVSQHHVLANGLWSLWILGDFAFIAPTVALYLALRHYNRTLALVGSLLSGFYIFYDISVTELNSLTLVSLSQGYASALSPAISASYIAAATYGYNALALQTVLSFGIGAVGSLLWSIVMVKSVFGWRTAGLGIVVNIIGIAGSASSVVPSSYVLGLLQFLTVPLSGLWFIIVGYKLYRHRSQLALMDGTTPPSLQPLMVTRVS